MTPTPRQTAQSLTAFTIVLTVLPLGQIAPIDFDRTALLMLLPALWLGRHHLRHAVAQVSVLPRPWFVTGWWALTGIVLSVLLSPHVAAAATTAAAWVVLAAAALLAGELCATEPTAGRRLLGGLTAGTVLGCLTVWVWWSSSDRGLVPLYAHHRIFGLHMMIGAIASAALVVRVWEHPRARLLALASGVVAWGGLLWAGGRAPVAATLFALAAWWLTGGKPLRRRLATTTCLLLAGGLLLSAAFWSDRPELGWWHALRRTTRVARDAASMSEFTSTRSEFWRMAAAHARERPWFGRGPDAYRFLTPKLDGQQPHNFLLQLWLDLGWLGALPVLLLLGRRMWRGAKAVLDGRGLNPDAPWLALALTCLLAGLLDGVFYHLLPLAGLALGLGSAAPPATAGETPPRSQPGCVAGGMAGLAAAAVLLLLHAILFHALNTAVPPATPAAWPARLLQVWPSSTVGLPRWLEQWRADDPRTSLTWARWAQDHSTNAPYLHTYAAQRLLELGDRSGAEAELRAALAKAHWSVQPAIKTMLRDLGFEPSSPRP